MSYHESPIRKSDDWMTPPAIVAALGPFDLDPAAPIGWPWLGRRTFSTALYHYTLCDDGLTMAWFGRVWLNPPYSDIAPWTERMAAHGRGTMLIHARTDTVYYQRDVLRAASGVLHMMGRVQFLRPDGQPAWSDKHRKFLKSGAPSVLVAYGAEDLDRLAASGIAGELVVLRLYVPRADGKTWAEIIWDVAAGRVEISVAEIYDRVRRHPKARGNRNVRAKVRQELQRGPYQGLGAGIWKPCV